MEAALTVRTTPCLSPVIPVFRFNLLTGMFGEAAIGPSWLVPNSEKDLYFDKNRQSHNCSISREWELAGAPHNGRIKRYESQ
jgi:hypothetical protein